MRKYLKIIFSWLLVIIWMGVIFFFSSMPSKESNFKSEKTINKVVEKTLVKTNDLGITDKHPSSKKMKLFVEYLNYPLRKCMHASIYFILALLVFNALRFTNTINTKRYFLTLFICFFYALLDEYHQTFVVGRTGQLMDVFIDTFGSLVGLCILIGITKLFKRIKNKNLNLSI